MTIQLIFFAVQYMGLNSCLSWNLPSDKIFRYGMGFIVNSSLPISLQYNYPFADYLILKIRRRIIKDPNVEIYSGFYPFFEMSCNSLS